MHGRVIMNITSIVDELKKNSYCDSEKNCVQSFIDQLVFVFNKMCTLNVK